MICLTDAYHTQHKAYIKVETHVLISQMTVPPMYNSMKCP